MIGVILAAGVGISGKSSGHATPIIIGIIAVAAIVGVIQLLRRRGKS